MNWLYTQWDWIQIKWLNMINIRLNIYKMRLNENNMTDINKIRFNIYSMAGHNTNTKRKDRIYKMPDEISTTHLNT